MKNFGKGFLYCVDPEKSINVVIGARAHISVPYPHGSDVKTRIERALTDEGFDCKVEGDGSCAFSFRLNTEAETGFVSGKPQSQARVNEIVEAVCRDWSERHDFCTDLQIRHGADVPDSWKRDSYSLDRSEVPGANLS